MNLRTLVAHTAVSMLGKMLSTTRLPAKSAGVTSVRSPLVRVNDGVGAPTVGSSPTVWTGLPPSAVCAMQAILPRTSEGVRHRPLRKLRTLASTTTATEMPMIHNW